MTTPSPFFTKPVLLNAESQIVQWCIKQGKTVINGSDMYTGKVVADSLTGNILKSTEYSGPNGTADNCGYSTTGSLFNLATGALSSKNFYIDTSGNAVFRGTVYASNGEFTGTISALSGTIGPSNSTNKWNIGGIAGGASYI
jgi:hypothetical protein